MSVLLNLIAYVLIPIPLCIILFLVYNPFLRMNRLIYNLVLKLLNFQLLNNLNMTLLHLLVLFAFVNMLFSLRELYLRNLISEDEIQTKFDLAYVIELRSKMLRSQRNFWVTLLNVCCWKFLDIFLHLYSHKNHED